MSAADAPAAAPVADAAVPEKVPLTQRLYARMTSKSPQKALEAFRSMPVAVNVQVCSQTQYDALDAATKAKYRSFHELFIPEKDARRYCRIVRKAREHIQAMRATEALMGPIHESTRFSPHPTLAAYWSAEAGLDILFDDLKELHDDLAEELLTVHE